jgi:hypothetical protein
MNVLAFFFSLWAICAGDSTSFFTISSFILGTLFIFNGILGSAGGTSWDCLSARRFFCCSTLVLEGEIYIYLKKFLT